jgi:DNA-binding LacI/PurR family transcriptional regulator
MIAVREAILKVAEDIVIIAIAEMAAVKMVQPPLTTSSELRSSILDKGKDAITKLLERSQGVLIIKTQILFPRRKLEKS